MRARERTRKRAVVLTCARACLLGRFTQAAGQGILEKKCPTFNRLCLAAMRTEAARKRACTKESECARVLLCFQTAACASWCTPGPSCGHRLARLSTAARSYSRRWALRFCVQRREFHPPCSRTRPPTRLVSEAAGDKRLVVIAAAQEPRDVGGSAGIVQTGSVAYSLSLCRRYSGDCGIRSALPYQNIVLAIRRAPIDNARAFTQKRLHAL